MIWLRLFIDLKYGVSLFPVNSMTAEKHIPIIVTQFTQNFKLIPSDRGFSFKIGGIDVINLQPGKTNSISSTCFRRKFLVHKLVS
ncbi:MAG: hypothetical protein PWQ55_2488 [Chloroflexota bacterium]|nr:hypothetical protein [Chloroflexota bacterium]